MRFTRITVITLTAIAAVVFVLFGIAFADGFFTGTFWDSDAWSGGTWLSWVMLALILVAGWRDASTIGDKAYDLHPQGPSSTVGQVDDPAFWKLITSNVHFHLLWLPVRFFLAKEWLGAGEHKLRDSAWMEGGQGLLGFWTRAIEMPDPESGHNPAITFDWYRSVLQYMIDHDWAPWFAKLISIGEFAIGLGLLVGALVGIAAFFGTLLNMSFMLAGATSTNPVLFGMTVFLILAWKIAGYFGIDRWLLAWLGTPWQRLDRTPPEAEAADRRLPSS